MQEWKVNELIEHITEHINEHISDPEEHYYKC